MPGAKCFTNLNKGLTVESFLSTHIILVLEPASTKEDHLATGATVNKNFHYLTLTKMGKFSIEVKEEKGEILVRFEPMLILSSST